MKTASVEKVRVDLRAAVPQFGTARSVVPVKLPGDGEAITFFVVAGKPSKASQMALGVAETRRAGQRQAIVTATA